MLRQVQNDLFDVGADLCTPIVADPKYPPLRITEDYVDRLEGWCDEFNADLAKLDCFILPGGTAGAALLHVARTVAGGPSGAPGRCSRPTPTRPTARRCCT